MSDCMWKNTQNQTQARASVASSLLKKVFLFALLFAASSAFAASCEAGFEDTLHIKVIDRQYRPIEGAEVTVTYQKDQTTGKGYITTNPQYTGPDGKVTETVRNIEQFDNRVDCEIAITAAYDGLVVEEEVGANSHAAEIILRFEDAYLLSLKVVDRFGQPIANASVRINEMYRNTSESGYVGIIVNQGTVDIAVPYLHGVLTEELEITEDTVYTLQARVYPFKLSVVDDLGMPLAAEINVDGDEYYGTGVEIAEMALPTPEVTITYGSLEKRVPVNLAEETQYTVSFDLTPPQISNIEVVRDENDLKITFFIKDPNGLASGVDLDETTVTYSVGGVTQTAVPYAESGAYAVEMPAPPDNSLLRFTITTHDKEGNMNTVNGEYLVTPEEEEPPPAEDGEGEATEESGDNTLLIIVGVVVVLIVAYAIWSYVRGLTEEE